MPNQLRPLVYDAIHALKVDNQTLLAQLRCLVDKLSAQNYQLVDVKWQSGSIGAHVRHVVEHYMSVLNAGEMVDYDHRNRDKTIETSVPDASHCIEQIIGALDNLFDDCPLQVTSSTSLNQAASVTSSSLARELSFLHSHSTHHMAIIRLLALSQNIYVEPEFGKAVSTQKFEANVQS